MTRAVVTASLAVLAPLELVAQPAYRLGRNTLRYQQQIEVRLGMRAGDIVAVVINEVNAVRLSRIAVRHGAAPGRAQAPGAPTPGNQVDQPGSAIASTCSRERSILWAS